MFCCGGQQLENLFRIDEELVIRDMIDNVCFLRSSETIL